MKYRIIVLVLLLISFRYAGNLAENYYLLCLDSVGSSKQEIEEEFGTAFRIEGELYRYDPSFLYSLTYSDTINVKYDDDLLAFDVSCAAP